MNRESLAAECVQLCAELLSLLAFQGSGVYKVAIVMLRALIAAQIVRKLIICTTSGEIMDGFIQVIPGASVGPGSPDQSAFPVTVGFSPLNNVVAQTAAFAACGFCVDPGKGPRISLPEGRPTGWSSHKRGLVATVGTVQGVGCSLFRIPADGKALSMATC